MSEKGYNDVAAAIRRRSACDLLKIMFEDDKPVLRSGFRTESYLWDFKRDCPPPGSSNENAWADFAKEVLGFHNYEGGLLLLGINNDFDFLGCTRTLDSKQINDKIRTYLGDTVWVQFYREFISRDQKYLGLAIVDRRGPNLLRFKCDAPLINGRRLFCKGDLAVRDQDSTRVLHGAEADTYARSLSVPTIGKIYSIDEPFFRILQPDYNTFLNRDPLSQNVLSGFANNRISVLSLTGIGGVGKTALATWAVQKAYEVARFKFIVSVTAKDRELTSTGIKPLISRLTSFEELLNSILEVLGFIEYRSCNVIEREKNVRELLKDSEGLLFVDNLETIDDERIITFLDDLPQGCRAITTSRRDRVKVAALPIAVPPLDDLEAAKFVNILSNQTGYHHLENLNEQERIKVGRVGNGIPLAIKWLAAQAKNSLEVVARAEKLESYNREGEELLEFCFRRVFDSLDNEQKDVLEILSLFNRPIPQEALLVATGLPSYKIADTTEVLLNDSMVQRLFDPDINDYSFTLLPIVRSFVYSVLRQKPDKEKNFRAKLTDYYEAKDVPDEARLAIREIRQGQESPEGALIDLANGATKRGDVNTADQLFQQALSRSPNSWRAAQAYAEFKRHVMKNIADALKLYDRAAVNAPSRGPERGKIFREYGLVLQKSGEPNATDLAIEKLQVALVESPNDPITRYTLAKLYQRKGKYSLAIDLLSNMINSERIETRTKAREVLLACYNATGETLKAGLLRRADIKNVVQITNG